MPNLSQQNQDRQHVLDSTDIVDLIGEHLTLTPKGREFVGICPFHDDHKPSMWVVPHKQIYHCFSCGAGGNAFDFMMNYHKMGFVDALKALADRAGITLTPFTPRRPGAPTDAALIDGQPDAESQFTAGELAAANAAALDFFRVILRHPEHGTTARDILAGRGIPDDMAERFMIGAAPDRWDGLRLTLSKKGYSDELLHAAGLIIPKQDQSGYYDGFRNRLMFPIHDQIGRVVAFGGRRIKPDDEPKYRNSPETAIFDKSATLYGLHQARRAVIDNRVMIVTEGYTDVIACHQAGIENVVATLGTALTARHARVLKRMCDTVILLFDGDEAGQRAADRALEVFFAEPIDVKIAVLPDNLDPDELLKQEDGRARFDAAIAGAVDALAYHGRRLRDKIQAIESTSGQTQLVERELERLVELGLNRVAPLRRGVILRDLASILGVEEAAVLAQARR
ncbi:MAG: DNA primase, partial [Phycisphaerales bacterium]|nr:DNA primase [Phycisphaerales bacterium]